MAAGVAEGAVRVAAGAVRVVVLVVLVSALVVPAGLRPTWGAGGEDFGGILGGGTECILQLFLKYFVMELHQDPNYCSKSRSQCTRGQFFAPTLGAIFSKGVYGRTCCFAVGSSPSSR
jgi:hypothetical protein